MDALSVNKKSVKEESGKLKKILGAVKKVVSKEFLWLLFVILICIPLSLIISYIISADAAIINEKISEEVEKISEIVTNEHPLYRVVYGVCFVGIYFSRMVASAIKTQLNDKK